MTREEILDRGMTAPLYAGTVPGATHRGEGRNQDCRDFVHFDFKIENGVVVEARHTCKACVLTTAVADMLCEWIEGHAPSKLRKLDPFSFIGEPVLPNRHECIKLPYEVACVSLHL